MKKPGLMIPFNKHKRRIIISLACAIVLVILFFVYQIYSGGNIVIDPQIIQNTNLDKIRYKYLEFEETGQFIVDTYAEGTNEEYIVIAPTSIYDDNVKTLIYIFPNGMEIDEPDAAVYEARYSRSGIREAIAGYYTFGTCTIKFSMSNKYVLISIIEYESDGTAHVIENELQRIIDIIND